MELTTANKHADAKRFAADNLEALVCVDVDHGLQFLAVDLSLQLHPGSFEYALHHLIEHEIDLTEIEARYANDKVDGQWKLYCLVHNIEKLANNGYAK